MNQFKFVKEEIPSILVKFITLGIINITNKEVINKKNIIISFLMFKLDKINKGINFWTVDSKKKFIKKNF